MENSRKSLQKYLLEVAESLAVEDIETLGATLIHGLDLYCFEVGLPFIDSEKMMEIALRHRPRRDVFETMKLAKKHAPCPLARYETMP